MKIVVVEDLIKELSKLNLKAPIMVSKLECLGDNLISKDMEIEQVIVEKDCIYLGVD